MKNNVIRNIGFYILLIFIIILFVTYLLDAVKVETIKYSDIILLFEQDKVVECEVDENLFLKVKTVDDQIIKYRLRDLYLFREDVGDTIKANLLNPDSHLKVYNITERDYVPEFVAYIPYIVLFIVIIVVWFVFMNQMTGKSGKISSFGKAKAKLGSEEKKKVYFADVAGADEEKEELREVVDFLKNPLKFVELGAKIPHGVLLVGPPGTGKTLLAKAVAGEAGVPFYSISGSDFVEMYVGVGASRVRDLFDTAKKNPASIIFIDEIDAVGRHRGAGLGGGHDEREQTLNQLLVEMDGFGSNEGVIVIAATNRPDILDPALLRPGRFDRQVTVNYPDIKGREEILKVHSRGKPFEKDLDLSVIAKTTAGFTGADLANLLNEAALLAARKQKKLIGMNDIEESMIKVMVGPQKKTKVISEREKKLTAYHEAGHAIVTRMLKSQDPVHQISIIPSGRAGGYTLSLPKEDKYYMSKQEMLDELVTLLGGRAAEKLIMLDISTGASNDIQRVTNLARKMITQYGMSDRLGPIVFGSGHDEVFLGREFNSSRNYSEKIAAEIDEEVKLMVDEAYDKAQKILEEKLDKLHFIAEYLLKFEIMDGSQFDAAMSGEPTIEELNQIISEKKKKSDEENRIARETAEAQKAQDEKRRAELFKKEQEELYKNAKDKEKNNKDSNDDISFKNGGSL